MSDPAAAPSALRWARRARTRVAASPVLRADGAALAIFAAVQAVAIGALGLRLDLGYLGFAPHLPDLATLRADLVGTLVHQHTQPPLYPAFVGGLLWLSPLPDGLTLHLAYLALGAVLAVVVRRLAGVLGLGPVAGLVAVALVAANPALLALFATPGHDPPAVVLLALLVLLSARWVGAGNPRHLAWWCATAAALVLTRSLFHPVWYPVALLGLAALRSPPRLDRRLVAVAVAPALLIGLAVAKNQVLVGEATLTTWSGPSASKVAAATADPEEQARLVRDGLVSPLFERMPFLGFEAYADVTDPCHRDHPGVRVLAEPVRPSNGSPNLNDECLLAVYRQQGADARAYIRAHPSRVLTSAAAGAQLFFEPTLPILVTENHAALADLEQVWSHTLGFRVTLDPVVDTNPGGLRVLAHGGIDLVPVLLVAVLAALGSGAAAIRRLWPGRTRGGTSARRAALGARAAIGLAVGWVLLVGSALEIGENARFRLLVEPLLLLTLVRFAALGWHRVQARRTAVGGSCP